MSVWALVLAAGFSSRMAPHFKPLLSLPLPQGEYSALETICACYQAEGVRPLVVGGHRWQEIAYRAHRCGAVFVRNPAPENGMFSSLCVGMTALPSEATAVFVHPVDIPLVRRMTLHMLLDAQETNTTEILIPSFMGQEGHPPLLPMSLRKRLCNYDGRGGLRAAITTMPHIFIPVADSFILRDMDSIDDYTAIKAASMKQDIFSLPEAEELLRLKAIPEPVQEHCRAVGTLAAAFARALNDAYKNKITHQVDETVARIGGLLHDICKGQRRHETAAGTMFRTWGMVNMAKLVEDHRDMDLPQNQILSERELVFLADKYISGTKRVTLVSRFQEKRKIFSDRPDICIEIDGRQRRAQNMANLFQQICGKDPEQIALRLVGES